MVEPPPKARFILARKGILSQLWRPRESVEMGSRSAKKEDDCFHMIRFVFELIREMDARSSREALIAQLRG